VKFVDINPQITPVRFSEPTGQAQIDADYAERIKGAYGKR
jgi:hypothetical protein